MVGQNQTVLLVLALHPAPVTETWRDSGVEGGNWGIYLLNRYTLLSLSFFVVSTIVTAP
jgi:hypothetical protein